MFTEMDANLESLKIKSYGVGVTTLEEVFLKVGDGIIPGYKEDMKESEDELENNEMLFEDYSIVT